MKYDTIKEIRKALRDSYGKGKYRITSNGEVHVYGPMPNATGQIGWSFKGYVEDHLRQRRL